MSVKNVWIRPYLLDVLNQLRGQLYNTKSGKPNPRRKTWTVRRSWASIFEGYEPLRTSDLPSKTKQRIVSEFEDMLRVLAKMDGARELRPGMPMSIRAYSERDPSRGGGRGEWRNLVIEATSNFRKYRESDISLS